MLTSMLNPKYKATVNHKKNEHLPFCTFHSNLNKPFLLPCFTLSKRRAGMARSSFMLLRGVTGVTCVTVA